MATVDRIEDKKVQTMHSEICDSPKQYQTSAEQYKSHVDRSIQWDTVVDLLITSSSLKFGTFSWGLSPKARFSTQQAAHPGEDLCVAGSSHPRNQS